MFLIAIGIIALIYTVAMLLAILAALTKFTITRIFEFLLGIPKKHTDIEPPRPQRRRVYLTDHEMARRWKALRDSHTRF